MDSWVNFTLEFDTHQPHFPIGITDNTFENVIGHLKVLNYEGPLALSCDDTQLLLALRPYYDVKKGQHFLLGTEYYRWRTHAPCCTKVLFSCSLISTICILVVASAEVPIAHVRQSMWSCEPIPNI